MILNHVKKTAGALAVAALALAASTAQAYQLTLDVTGIESRDEFGVPGNEMRFLDLFAGARVTGLAWNVSLFTFGTSRLSEIAVDLSDGGIAGLSLAPAFDDYFPGADSYVGSADLVALGADFTVGSTGRLFLEFYEIFNDFAGADGGWRSGSLTVTYVPEPTSFALAGIALLGLGAASRRGRKLQS